MTKSDFELLLKHRGDVMEKHNFIEGHMSFVMSNHFNPKDKGNFISILMNSSIIGFGNKIKVLRGLKYINGKQGQKLYELASIRNAFAHQDLASIVENEDNGNEEKEIVNFKLPILHQSGSIENLDPFEHYRKYIELYNECLRFMRNILAASSMKDLGS